MPPRTSFKADSSFFEKIAVGVVGARAVSEYLSSFGHVVAELERGALDVKLWKEVKRKRVRIPDLVCTRCGQRIESRAKTKPEISMSHSPTDSERSWDFGMVSEDWVAFPVCVPALRKEWAQGRLSNDSSYWRERKWTYWQPRGAINIFAVRDLRAKAPDIKPAKAASEGSETQIYWRAKFAAGDGEIGGLDPSIIRYVVGDGHRVRTLRLENARGDALKPAVEIGARIREHQILAGAVSPVQSEQLRCRSDLSEAFVAKMMGSRERTLRYTGCRLSKLRQLRSLEAMVRELADDPAEDWYTRLEARSFLVTVADDDARVHFAELLEEGVDSPLRLESVITLADTPSTSAMRLLIAELEEGRSPLYLRSACAWALGRFADREAGEALVRTFGEMDSGLKWEALNSLAGLGSDVFPSLEEGILSQNQDVAAGCAEVMRRLEAPISSIVDLAELRDSAHWPLWVLAHTPRDRVAPHIVAWQRERPDLHFALAVLWSFLESWVAEFWEKELDGL